MSCDGSTMRGAETADVDALYAMINDAYMIEVGDSGVAFKTCSRYQSLPQLDAELAAALADPLSMFTLIAGPTPAVQLSPGSSAAAAAVANTDPEEKGGDGAAGASSGTGTLPRGRNGGAILGCIRARVWTSTAPEDGRRLCEFGPYAVVPAQQGTGVGARLLAEVERFGAANGAKVIQIMVVNHRSDVRTYYQRRGFAEVGEAEFGGNFDLSSLTRPSHFIVMEKGLGLDSA